MDDTKYYYHNCNFDRLATLSKTVQATAASASSLEKVIRLGTEKRKGCSSILLRARERERERERKREREREREEKTASCWLF
jgi:hypothetical protein